MPLSGYLKLLCKSDILVDIKKVWRHVPYNEMELKNRTIKFDNFKSDEKTRIKKAQVSQI